jgi:hypothetical protein
MKVKNNNKVTSVDFDVWVEVIFTTKLRYMSSFEDDQIVTDNRIQLPIKKILRLLLLRRLTDPFKIGFIIFETWFKIKDS